MGKLTFVAAAFAALALAGAARAAAVVVPAPAVEGHAGDKVRMNVSQLTLGAGERMPDHQPVHLRYIYVVSGRLQVSNLVTGGSQVVGAGEMTVETAGEMHSVKALGDDPARLMIVEQPEG